MIDMNADYVSGVLAGRDHTREKAIKMLESYLETTRMPADGGEQPISGDWDLGFQAAIAILSNDYNWQGSEKK